MCLFKCKCGCMFTIKKLGNRHLACPDCKASVPITSYSDQGDTDAVCSETGITVQKIPDTSKISVTFNA